MVSSGSSARRPKSPPFYPQRVPLDNIITGHTPSWRLGVTPNVNSDSELEESSLEDHSVDSSCLDSEAEIEVSKSILTRNERILAAGLI